ncbi:MAG: PD40 domain-containing protein [Deltaproteobacteria bacterium]|nr:PD40 domain-containing protein [Deltaproteobacteria bacterium]
MLPFLLLSGLAWAQARPVTPTYSGNCQAPSWSPDGARLTFEVNDHEARKLELYAYRPGGGNPTAVRPPVAAAPARTAGFTGSGGGLVIADVAWAPAMIGRFVYTASTGTGDYDVFVEGSSTPLSSSPDAEGDPTWSADSFSIVFTSGRTGQGDLYLVDLRALGQPPRRLTQGADAAELDARFSPTGRALVYVSHRNGADRVMLIEDVDAPSPKPLTAAGGSQTRPTWSPDGARIAFYDHSDPNGRVDLAVIPRGGGPAQVLVKGVVPNTRGPSWTADSRHLVLVKDEDDRFDPVYAVPADGSAQPRLIATGTVGNADTDVVRGTDGKTWLAVAAQGLSGDTTRDFRRIFVMPLSGL